MEEKSIKAISRISAPILNQGDIFGYTDDERQSLRVGMLSKLPNSGNKEFEVLGLGMLPDDKGWTFDGRVRSVDPANILCVITPDIENSHLIFEGEGENRAEVIIKITKAMIKQIRKSKKRMVKAEAKGLEYTYGLADQNPAVKKATKRPSRKAELTEEEKEERRKAREEKKLIKEQIIRMSQAPVPAPIPEFRTPKITQAMDLNGTQNQPINLEESQDRNEDQMSVENEPDLGGLTKSSKTEEIEFQVQIQEQKTSMLKKRSIPSNLNQIDTSKSKSTKKLKTKDSTNFLDNNENNPANNHTEEKLPSFLRTTTTNLRFDSSKRISASQEVENPRNFTKYLLHDKHRILKSFSQDMTALVQDIIFENKRMMFLQGVKQILVNFNSSAIARRSDTIQIDQSVLNSTYYGTIPNPEELTLISSCFIRMEELVIMANQGIERVEDKELEAAGQMSKMAESDHLGFSFGGGRTINSVKKGNGGGVENGGPHVEENKLEALNLFYYIDLLYYFNIAKKMQVLVKFMMTREQYFLHKLKKKLYFDEFSDIDDHFAYSADLSLDNIMKRVLVLFSEDLIHDYYSNFSELCLMIVRDFRRSFDEIMLKMKAQEQQGDSQEQELTDLDVSKITLMRESVAFEVFRSSLQELMRTPKYLNYTKEVYFGIFRMVSLKTNFTMSKNQPKLVKKFNQMFSSSFNCTQQVWNHFVDCYTEYIQAEKSALVQAIAARPKLLNTNVKKLFSCKAGLQKALSMSLVRNFIGRYLLNLSVTNQGLSGELKDFLESLYNNEQRLPLIVYLVQCLVEKAGSVDALKDSNLGVVENFAKEHLTIDAEQEIEDCRIVHELYDEYLKVKDRVVFLAENDEVEGMVELLRDVTVRMDVRNGVGGANQGGDGGEDGEDKDGGQQKPGKRRKKRATKNKKKKKNAAELRRIKEQKKLNRYFFFLTLLNESYLMRACKHKDMPAYLKKLETFFIKNQQILQAVLTEPEMSLTLNILNNFADYPCLRMKKNYKAEKLMSRIQLVHFFIFFITSENRVLRPTDYDDEYTFRLQLGYLAGEDNSQFEALAPMVIAKKANNNQAWLISDATSLNKHSCGFFYFIGNCGQAMQSTRCPKCGGNIGGQHHKLNKGNSAATAAQFIKAYAEYEKENLAYVKREIAEIRKKENYTPIRAMPKMEDFKLVDMIGHARYLFDYVSCSQAFRNNVSEYIELGEDESVEYLFSIYNAYFRFFKTSLKSYCNAFQCINVLIEESCMRLVLDNEDRNTIEEDLGINFREFRRSYKQTMIEKKMLKEVFKDSARTTRNVVADWVNKLTGVSEFKSKGFDVRIVTGLRIATNEPTMEGFREQLIGTVRKKTALMGGEVAGVDAGGVRRQTTIQIRTGVEEDKLKTEVKKCEFLQFVMKNEDVLRNFPRLLHTHVDLVNYLQKKFDYRVSYQLACAVSIGDLISDDGDEDEKENRKGSKNKKRRDSRGNRNNRKGSWSKRGGGSGGEEEDNDDPDKLDEENLELQKAELIKKFGPDLILEKKFYDLIEVWEYIMRVRDHHPEIFDFRFLCHAQDLPEDKIREIMTPRTAKLIYFLPNEKYVESLFISSTLQTLSKFQNLVLQTYMNFYISTNFKKPERTAVQKAGYGQIISLDEDFQNLIKKGSYRNPKFNQEAEFIFDAEWISKQVCQNMLKEKSFLLFEGDFIKHFNFAGSFNEVSTFISSVAMRVPQKELRKFSYKQLIKICVKEPEQVFAVFARKIAELSPRAKTLAAGHIIRFQKEKVPGERDDDDPGRLVLLKTLKRKSNVISSLNAAKIRIETLREAYEIIEEHIYEFGVDNLDVIFKVDLEQNDLIKLKRAVKLVDEEQLDVINRVCRSMLLRQLVGSTRETLAQMSVRMCIEWADALHDDEEISEQFLNVIGDDIQMRHLYSMINNM